MALRLEAGPLASAQGAAGPANSGLASRRRGWASKSFFTLVAVTKSRETPKGGGIPLGRVRPRNHPRNGLL